jgi:hypothetical protein
MNDKRAIPFSLTATVVYQVRVPGKMSLSSLGRVSWNFLIDPYDTMVPEEIPTHLELAIIETMRTL